MGDYYRMSLWADLENSIETANFLARSDFGIFLRGSCYYHDGGTTYIHVLDEISETVRLAVVSHWKVNWRDQFECTFLPALADLLADDDHDPLLGFLVSESQTYEHIWWNGASIALLSHDEYLAVRADHIVDANKMEVGGVVPPEELGAMRAALEAEFEGTGL